MKGGGGSRNEGPEGRVFGEGAEDSPRGRGRSPFLPRVHAANPTKAILIKRHFPVGIRSAASAALQRRSSTRGVGAGMGMGMTRLLRA
jgi:hypothetical protein